jgi:hypothetical protein
MQKQNPSLLISNSAMPAGREVLNPSEYAGSVAGLPKMFETNTRAFACNCPP